ncbi:unnamed protein product [Urochloa decumbens]
MAEDGYPVKLHIYDLSQGMARQLSATILGKAIEGIWHTGVVVYGREYYFGGGIQQGQPGRTPYGTPVRVEDLGVTHVPREVFEDFLREIGPRYTPATYNLLSHNCNNFSNEAAQFLASSAVPSYILQLPNEVMNSPMGALIMPMIQGLETSLRAGAVPQPPQFRSAATATAKQPSTNRVEARSTAADKPEAPATKEVEARPATVDKPEAGETAGSGDGNDGSPAVPPAVQPAAPLAAAALVSAAAPAVVAAAPPADKPEALATKDVEAGSAAAHKTEAGETASNDADNDGSPAVPPAVQPAAPPPAAVKVSAAAPAAAAVVTKEAAAAAPADRPEALATKDVEAGSAAADKPEAGETASNDGSPAVPPAVQPAAPPAAAAQVSAAAVVATKAAAPPEDPLAEAKSRAQEEIRREFTAIMAAGTARAGEAAALAMRRVMERHGLQRAAAQRG